MPTLLPGALLYIPANEKGPESFDVLKSVRHSRRNVKDIAGLERLFDPAADGAAGRVVHSRPLLAIDERAAGDRRGRARLHYPSVDGLGVNQGGIAFFHDANIDTVGSSLH